MNVHSRLGPSESICCATSLRFEQMAASASDCLVRVRQLLRRLEVWHILENRGSEP